ncbi:MAG TPA: hypothetical protein VGE77_06250 [Nocardioides sp.]
MSTTQASNDPEVFAVQIEAAIDAVTEAIGQMFEDIATFINNNLDWILPLVGGGIGSLGGPLGALGGAGLGWLASQSLQGIFDDACTQVSEAWEAGVETIRQAVGDIFGDPLQMAVIAASYQDARGELDDMTFQVGQLETFLGNDWSGDGFNAYVAVAQQQATAAAGISGLLSDAATLLNQGSTEMVQYWSNQLTNVTHLSMDVTSAAGSFASLDKATGAWVAPTLDLIATAVNGVADIVNTAVQYYVGLAVQYAGSWDDLNASLGDAGLPNGEWPRFDLLLGDLNGQWDHT